MNDDFMTLIPSHRTYINHLINKNLIDSYAVSMESQTVWITFNAETKEEVDQLLMKSPLYKFWQYNIEELFVYDGQLFRMPSLQMN
jgi:diphthamide synthase (EF-2-diphthine--ammonia ligase)